MTTQTGQLYIASCIEQVLAAHPMEEQLSDGAAFMALRSLEDTDAGSVRLWQAEPHSALDRMAHVQLLAGPVVTQLFFIFGKRSGCMPHFHSQLVQFPPDGCVYNADLMPRLDAVMHPGYFTNVYSDLTKPYLKATSKTENSCSKALMNPAIAAFLSPWGIVSHRTDTAEYERVRPHLDAYLTHYLQLPESLQSTASSEELTQRDAAHLERFFDDDLDPRAWNGVYRIIGEAAGKQIKAILKTPLNK